MKLQVSAGVLVRAPDGGEAGRLRRHDVDSVAVIRRHAGDAGADELHDLVLHIAVLEDRADDRERDVLRADKRRRTALEIYGNDLGVVDIVGILQELLDELSPALADRHGAERTIARVRIGAEDHFAAAGVHLAHVLVDDGDVRRDIDPAVSPRGGETEHVVVLVDRAADGAERVVAVGEHIGHGKALHAGGLRRLDDADEGDIMGSHGVELQAQTLHVAGGVVRLEDGPGDRTFAGSFAVILRRSVCRNKLGSVYQKDALIGESNHMTCLLS